MRSTLSLSLKMLRVLPVDTRMRFELSQARADAGLLSGAAAMPLIRITGERWTDDTTSRGVDVGSMDGCCSSAMASMPAIKQLKTVSAIYLLSQNSVGVTWLEGRKARSAERHRP